MVNTSQDKNHVNQFEDVHAKIRAFKDRLLAANERDVQNRQLRAAKDAKEALNKVGEPAPSATIDS